MTAETATRAETTARPQRPKRRLGRRVVLAVVLLAVLASLGMWRYGRHNFKRFRELRPGVMYRMGQPSEYGLERIAKEYGLRTIICLREGEIHLRSGMFFELHKNSGRPEAEACEDLGIRFLHWPLVHEAHWPWPTPWHLEHFYRLMDDPANLPVMVHCMAGKHRAGTLSAIFRLEYDRWDPERVLEEMYSFRFGDPRSIQEHNLRTYLPRPRPDAVGQQAVAAAFGPMLDDRPPAEFEALLRQLRAARGQPHLETALGDYVAARKPFALGLAQRLIDSPDDPLAPVACKLAAECAGRPDAAAADWQAAAGLIADFGTPQQQRKLLDLLEAGVREAEVSLRYAALASGATGRFTENRLAYARPLLDDLRARPEPAAAMYRYADTAVARLATIKNVDLLKMLQGADRAVWDKGIERAKRWFDEHPESALPGPLRLPAKPSDSDAI